MFIIPMSAHNLCSLNKNKDTRPHCTLVSRQEERQNSCLYKYVQLSQHTAQRDKASLQTVPACVTKEEKNILDS